MDFTEICLIIYGVVTVKREVLNDYYKKTEVQKMKIYYTVGNISGFCVGVLCEITSVICILKGFGRGFLYSSSGLECYLHESVIILLGIFLISLLFWNKKKTVTWMESIVVCFLVPLLSEIIPHFVVQYLR